MTRTPTPTSPPASVSPFAAELRSASVGATALISLFALEYIAVGAAMPTVARALDGYHLYNMAFGATIAASVLGMVLGGWWSDHAGPRPVVLTGSLAFAVGLLVCGLAPSMEVLVAGRGLQGLGSGLSSVALYVVIAQRIPEAVRPRVFSLLAAAWVVPGLAGPLFTGSVVQHWGWRWVFLTVAPLVLVALAVIAPALRSTHQAREAPYLSRATLGWAALAAVAVALLNLLGERLSAWEVMAAAAALLVLGLAARHLLPPGSLVLRRGLPSVIGVRGLLGGSFLAAEAYLPLMLQDLHGYTPARAGAVLAVASCAWALGSAVQGRLPASADRYRVMVAGAALYLLAVGAVAAAVWTQAPGWLVIVLYGVSTLGVGLAYPTTSLVTMRLSPPEEIGRNSSALQVAEALTGALGLAVTGVTFSRWYGADPRTAFASTALVAVLLGVLCLLSALRARPHGDTPA